MAGAFNPAFDSRVDVGMASGNVFADGAPVVALLGGAFAYAVAVLAGVAEVVIRGHIVCVGLRGGGERAAPGEGAGGVERLFTALADLVSGLVNACQHQLLLFGRGAGGGSGGCVAFSPGKRAGYPNYRCERGRKKRPNQRALCECLIHRISRFRPSWAWRLF